MDLMLKTLDDCPDIGQVLYTHTDPETGFKVLVSRGGFCFLAYIGVPEDHPLASLEELGFECHCGITFQSWGDDDFGRESGFFWSGWDYGHAWDYTATHEVLTELAVMYPAFARRRNALDCKNWSVGEVVEQAMSALAQTIAFAKTLVSVPDVIEVIASIKHEAREAKDSGESYDVANAVLSRIAAM